MGRSTPVTYARLVTRVYAWLQRHPILVDGSIAAVLFLFGAIGVLQEVQNGSALPGDAAALCIGMPVLLRRRVPALAFWMVCAIGLIQLAYGRTLTPSDLAVPAALY